MLIMLIAEAPRRPELAEVIREPLQVMNEILATRARPATQPPPLAVDHWRTGTQGNREDHLAAASP